jgi:hypothetical protein
VALKKLVRTMRAYRSARVQSLEDIHLVENSGNLGVESNIYKNHLRDILTKTALPKKEILNHQSAVK